jgi:hypothetical protein
VAQANLWARSTFETISSFLAVLVGIWEEGLITNNLVLLTEIGTALTLATLLAAHLVTRYWKPMARPFAKGLLKALLWLTLVIAGSLFTYAYSLVLSYGLIGVEWLAIYGLVVLWFIREIKAREFRLRV